jgi:hypothetical protein
MNTATFADDRTVTIGLGQPWFEARDVAAFIMAAVMTLGPLAAATLSA